MSEPIEKKTGRGGDNSAAHTAAVKEIRDYLRAAGAWELKVHGGMYQRDSIPDILACFPPDGRFVAIEVKTGVGKMTPGQVEEIASIWRAGGLAFVLNNSDQLERWLVEYDVIPKKMNLSYQTPAQG